MSIFKPLVAGLLLTALLLPGAFAQESLQKSLEEEEEYYNNFGISGYSRKRSNSRKYPITTFLEDTWSTAI